MENQIILSFSTSHACGLQVETIEIKGNEAAGLKILRNTLKHKCGVCLGLKQHKAERTFH